MRWRARVLGTARRRTPSSKAKGETPSSHMRQQASPSWDRRGPAPRCQRCSAALAVLDLSTFIHRSFHTCGQRAAKRGAVVHGIPQQGASKQNRTGGGGNAPREGGRPHKNPPGGGPEGG